MTGRVIGVYSFPKSGNTWMRHILSKALGGQNAYKTVPDIYTDSIWEHPVQVGGAETVFYKSHSKNEVRKAHGRDFENDLILYVVRHPLDVFLSQLNYVSANVMANPNIVLPCQSVEDVVARGELDLFFGAFCTFGTLQPQFADAGSWFSNALNWKTRAEAEPERVLIIRYEDMINHGSDALKDAARRIGLTGEEIASGFDTAKASTKADGKFFWKQKAGNYHDILSDEMIDRYCNIFSSSLEAFGYSADN